MTPKPFPVELSPHLIFESTNKPSRKNVKTPNLSLSHVKSLQKFLECQLAQKEN